MYHLKVDFVDLWEKSLSFAGNAFQCTRSSTVLLSRIQNFFIEYETRINRKSKDKRNANMDQCLRSPLRRTSSLIPIIIITIITKINTSKNSISKKSSTKISITSMTSKIIRSTTITKTRLV